MAVISGKHENLNTPPHERNKPHQAAFYIFHMIQGFLSNLEYYAFIERCYDFPREVTRDLPMIDDENKNKLRARYRIPGGPTVNIFCHPVREPKTGDVYADTFDVVFFDSVYPDNPEVQDMMHELTQTFPHTEERARLNARMRKHSDKFKSLIIVSGGEYGNTKSFWLDLFSTGHLMTKESGPAPCHYYDSFTFSKMKPRELSPDMQLVMTQRMHKAQFLQTLCYRALHEAPQHQPFDSRRI